jgi:hypothetical protein
MRRHENKRQTIMHDVIVFVLGIIVFAMYSFCVVCPLLFV